MRRPAAVPRTALCVLAAVVLVAPLPAQGGAGGPGGQGPPPLPDHWLTLDSLAQAVGLSAAAKARVAEPYTALNAVMRDAAARRRAMRERTQQELGGRSIADLAEADRARMRARFDSSRAEMEGFQAEADQWHAAIRALQTVGIEVKSIRDVTPIPHNGCRPTKRRRV